MLDQKTIDQLKKIVREENLQIHSENVFLSPENTRAISEIVKFANQVENPERGRKEKFKILPSGSNSILDLSKLSHKNMVVLKSDKLNRIKKVVPEDLYVILEAGFPLKDLNQRLEPFNLFYPLADSKSVGTIGGSVATNLKGRSGEREIQTKEYVLALEMISPGGEILHVGARTFKSVTGYDLPRLFVGSWGSLGFISEISLRLTPSRKRKYYPAFIPDPPPTCENKNQNDLKSILSSRIKKALDPNEVFFSLGSLA